MLFPSDARCDIVAEIGASHNQSERDLKDLLSDVAESGAGGIKVQIFTPEEMTLNDGRLVCRHWPWLGVPLWDLYRKAAFPEGLMHHVLNACDEHDLKLVVSVYSRKGVDHVMGVTHPGQVTALKIASFELNDIPLIKHAASTGLPLILSTGMATNTEVDEAISAAYAYSSAGPVTILHCISVYPTPAYQANLTRIGELQRIAALNPALVKVGYSDHTTSTVIPAVAVSLGAKMVEKHLKGREDKGLDETFAIDKYNFAEMVRGIRDTEAAMQPHPVTEFTDLRRSLYVVADIEVGGVFTEENVRSIRPSGGLLPKYLPDVLGKKARRKLSRGNPLIKGDVDGLDAEAGVGSSQSLGAPTAPFQPPNFPPAGLR